MPTVTLITSRYALTSPVDADRDLEPVQRALAARGVTCDLVDWRTTSDLSGRDLIVVKSPWDYAQHAEEFVDWLAAVQAQTRVVNDPGVIRWNLDKRYLGELAGRGVPVCPTVFCTQLDEVRAAIAAAPGRVVVKPTVSAASANTGLFEPDDPAALALARRILRLGKDVMVQPAIEAIARVGERALIHVDGRFVHAVCKGPLLALGGGLLGGDAYAETISPVRPDPDELQVASRTLAAAADLLAVRGIDEAPLHARVDLARAADGTPVVCELELFEPSLFLELAPGAERLYADAVLARLEP